MYDPDNPDLELVWRDGRVEEVRQERMKGNWERADNEENLMEDEDRFEDKEIKVDLEMVVAVDGGQIVNEN